jgi:large subunit ribosomal protein L15
MPLQRRIPKRGFTNINRVEYQVVNVRDLDVFDGEVTVEGLRSAGLVRNLKQPVKVLGQGELEKALSVEAHAFSKSAKEKIEAAGGSVSVLGSDDAGQA